MYRTRLAIWWPLATALALPWAPATVASSDSPAVAATQDRDPDSAATCGLCHTEIHREWSGRAHGKAWTDPIYQAALEETRNPERCHDCHIPEPIHARLGKRPRARGANHAEGVTCVSCHKDGERIAGPFGSTTDAHPTVKHPAFSESGSNNLCASCHSTRIGPVLPVARDFDEAGFAQEGKSCIGCHMPEVERPLAVSFVTGKPTGEPRKGRRHTVLGPGDPEFCREAFAVAVRRDGAHAVLSIENRAGHRVPGLTLREFSFTVTLGSADGKGTTEHVVVLSADNVLKAKETREFRFDLRSDRARAEVAVAHRFQKNVTPILTQSFDL